MKALTIAKRDIFAAATTPLLYVVSGFFTFLAGYFFFGLLRKFNVIAQQATFTNSAAPSLSEYVVLPYFQTLTIVLVFLVPIISMRSFAEERARGTYVLLFTSPVTPLGLAVGKFLGVLGQLLVITLCAAVYPVILMTVSEPEILPTVVACGGFLLVALGFAAVGVFISSCTSSQTIAAAVSLMTLLVFYVIDAPADQFPGLVGRFLAAAAPAFHAETLYRGVISGTDVVYFLSLIVVGIFLTERVIEAERWRA